jgi:hypothetical protein
MINNLKMGYHKLKFYSGVNWSKTLYFNFKKFPYRIAKLPVFLRKVKQRFLVRLKSLPY